MYEVFHGRNRWVLAAGQALVSFALLSSAHETLNLDHLFHILLVELLLFYKLLSYDHASCQRLELNDHIFMLLNISKYGANMHTEVHCASTSLQLNDFGLMVVEFAQCFESALSLNKTPTGRLEVEYGGSLCL